MIQVRQVVRADGGKGFEVTAIEPGLGTFSAPAKSAEEAALAVRHYYGDTRHVAPVPHCPFCR